MYQLLSICLGQSQQQNGGKRRPAPQGQLLFETSERGPNRELQMTRDSCAGVFSIKIQRRGILPARRQLLKARHLPNPSPASC
jgi:hypothetical protein